MIFFLQAPNQEVSLRFLPTGSRRFSLGRLYSGITLKASMATGVAGSSGQASFPVQDSPADSGGWLMGNLPDSFLSDSGFDDPLTLTGSSPGDASVCP